METVEEHQTVIEIREGEESVEMIGEAIMRISDAAEGLTRSGLTERALILLIQDKIGVANINKKDIENVLRAIPKLRHYLG